MADEPAPVPQDEKPAPDPRLLEAVAGYESITQKVFLDSYARLLDDLHRNGPRYEENMEYLLHQHDKVARKHLWDIQRKKLFNLECQWRAEQVQVPGARLTADFEDWHEHIEQCRVVPPISPDELALYDAFLAQLTDPDDLRDRNEWTRWWFIRRYPDVEDIETEDDLEQMLPEWSHFYDLHRGTGHLRHLPDVRGDKEHRYVQAGFRAREQEDPSPPYVPDPRPRLALYGPEFDDFVRELLRRFEPAATLRHFEAKLYLDETDATEDRLDLPLALERLHNAGLQPVPIRAHADWRAAVIEAANLHYLAQLRAALPRAYEDYCQRETLGISHARPRERKRYLKEGPHVRFEALAEQVVKGRAALGEPEDLDF